MLRWNWILMCAMVLVLAGGLAQAQTPTSTTSTSKAADKPTLTPDEEQALLDATDKPKPGAGMMGDGRMRRQRQMDGPMEGPMDGPPPHGPGMRGEPPLLLTPEQEAHLFTVLQEVNPELIEKIKTWQQVNPERSGRMLARMYERMQDVIQLKQADPAMYELKVQDLKLDARSRLMALAYRREKTDETRKDLLNILTEQFDIRQKIRERELERMKEKIGQLESQLEERASNRQKYIDKQLEEITRKPGSPKW